MIRTAAPLVALSLLGLAACGGSERSDTTAPPNADVVVRAQPALAFDQAGYTATAHDGKVVITLIDDASISHNLHVVDANGKVIDPNSPKLAVDNSGDSSTGTFHLAPGSYFIVCSVPGHNSMKSSLTVG